MGEESKGEERRREEGMAKGEERRRGDERGDERKGWQRERRGGEKEIQEWREGEMSRIKDRREDTLRWRTWSL